jgi:hypothetical protein
MFNQVIHFFNNFVLYLFGFIYKWFNIETMEDKFHKDKKDNNNSMNKVIFKFNNEDEFNIVKNNTLNIISHKDFLTKYQISVDSILNNTNNKLALSFNKNCIYIHFNHYYISGPSMFVLLNKMVDSTPPMFLKTNPFYGIINLPFYIYELMSLKKKEYIKTEKRYEHIIIEKQIDTTNKRFYSYLSTLNKVYHSLQMNKPMTVALSIGFDELPFINNNVGLIIINYDINDTINTLEQKIKNAYYQAFCSNFIINCPLPSIGNAELRDYVDCIISSIYIKTDYDLKIAWNCSKSPVEQMYVGSVSILHSDNTMDINMCMNTCSKNYNNSYECIDNFFD